MAKVRRIFVMFSLGALAFALGCEDRDEPAAVFQLQVVDEVFHVGVNDPAQIDSFTARLASGHEGTMTGTLIQGDGGFNGPWSWHLDPETVEVADVTTEVCDGRPSMVEDDLDYWLDTVRYYCPWGARVVSRVR